MLTGIPDHSLNPIKMVWVRILSGKYKGFGVKQPTIAKSITVSCVVHGKGMKYCMNEIIHSIIDLSYIVLEVLTVFVFKPFRPNLR